jgi:hypothetical protein
MGNTHGVSDSNKPAAKNAPITNHKLPDLNTSVVLSVSLAISTLPAALANVPTVGKVTEIFFLIGA